MFIVHCAGLTEVVTSLISKTRLIADTPLNLLSEALNDNVYFILQNNVGPVVNAMNISTEYLQREVHATGDQMNKLELAFLATCLGTQCSYLFGRNCTLSDTWVHVCL